MRRVILASLLIFTGIGFISFTYGFNPFSKKSWKKIGKKIKKGTKEIEKIGKKAVTKIGQCANAVKLALEYGAKKAAVETAKAGLTIAESATKVSRKSLNAAKDTLTFAKNAQRNLLKIVNETQKGVLTASNEMQKVSLAAAGETAIFASKVADISATALLKGINIEKMTLDADFSEFKKGKLPQFTINGVLFGKRINTKLKLDLSNIKSVLEQLVNAVF